MKKIYALLLLFIMLFLASCSEAVNTNTGDEPATAGTTESATETTSESASDTTTAYPPQTARINKQLAPSFSVFDKDGKQYSIFDFDGKPIVVNFWKSDCSPCKKEMPNFQAMYEKYGDEVHFLMLNCTSLSGETESKATALVNAGGYTFPVYFDKKGASVRAYFSGPTITLPTTFFITSDGYVNTKVTGEITKTKLEAEILNIMDE